ncbi:MAG: hypothetical protein JXQ82_07670 [Methanomicrobiaceae archaeon]|nr:hypothetical protein [Methanomicrobiaceae archaeon]
MSNYADKLSISIMGLICVCFLLSCGCTSSASNSGDDAIIKTVTFGGYPEDSYWATSTLLLYDKPGGLQAGAKVVSRVEKPLGATTKIYEIKDVDGTVFYKVEIKNKIGWTTEYIVTGKE